MNTKILKYLIIIILIISSCTKSSEEEMNTPIETYKIIGKWVGSYTCPQGLTGLTLTINGNDKNIDATFSFYPLASNPNVPSGNFSMEGIYNGDGKLKLIATEWVNRPAGYQMVDVKATINKNAETLAGKICENPFTLLKE